MWYALLWLLCLGCGLLSPRTPEPPAPDTDSKGYRQPISPDIVAENLRSAVSRRDAVALLGCLVDSVQLPGSSYQFEPSAQARARFPGVFARWGRDEEYRSFSAMMQRVAVAQVPELLYISPVFEYRTPDSAVFRSEYQLYVPHTDPTLPTIARGILRWTLVAQSNGLWAILRWSDFDSDSVQPSWSMLKAYWSR
jgi:hypothetical protein